MKWKRNWVLCAAIAWVATGLVAGCRTSEERDVRNSMPDWVRAEATAQIGKYFGQGPFRGVPLLDQSEDWSVLENWPEKFRFEGYIFRVEYGTFGSDWFDRVHSPKEFGPDAGSSLNYKFNVTNTTTAVPSIFAVHKFYSYWNRHGHTRDQGIRWNGEMVVSFDYYPDGRLHSFGRELNGATKVEYFDRQGRVAGWRHGPGCHWGGKQVTVEEFQTALGVLKRSVPEMVWE